MLHLRILLKLSHTCFIFSRSFIAQLRLGILPLRIETGRFENLKDSLTGRFRKLKVEVRKCQICNLDDIEDEKHFYVYARFMMVNVI